MANFMIAHLADGRFGGTEILDRATAQLMHRRSFAADPRLDGYAHGFEEETVAGHRVIMHDGSWEGFRTALLLVPDTGLGLFVSTNSPGGVDAVTGLLPASSTASCPASPRPAPRPPAARRPAARPPRRRVGGRRRSRASTSPPATTPRPSRSCSPSPPPCG